eukprot:540538-Amphidinium_carterae.1
MATEPIKFIRQFQNWRDEIYNYENATQTALPNSMKMTMLLQHIQGDIKSHLLLTANLVNPDFDNAATTVEGYYRNVYMHNNYSAGTNDMVRENTPKERTKEKKSMHQRPYVQGKGRGSYGKYNTYKRTNPGRYTKGTDKGKSGKNK